MSKYQVGEVERKGIAHMVFLEIEEGVQGPCQDHLTKSTCTQCWFHEITKNQGSAGLTRGWNEWASKMLALRQGLNAEADRQEVERQQYPSAYTPFSARCTPAKREVNYTDEVQNKRRLAAEEEHASLPVHHAQAASAGEAPVSASGQQEAEGSGNTADKPAGLQAQCETQDAPMPYRKGEEGNADQANSAEGDLGQEDAAPPVRHSVDHATETPHAGAGSGPDSVSCPQPGNPVSLTPPPGFEQTTRGDTAGVSAEFSTSDRQDQPHLTQGWMATLPAKIFDTEGGTGSEVPRCTLPPGALPRISDDGEFWVEKPVFAGINNHMRNIESMINQKITRTLTERVALKIIDWWAKEGKRCVEENKCQTCMGTGRARRGCVACLTPLYEGRLDLFQSMLDKCREQSLLLRAPARIDRQEYQKAENFLNSRGDVRKAVLVPASEMTSADVQRLAECSGQYQACEADRIYGVRREVALKEFDQGRRIDQGRHGRDNVTELPAPILCAPYRYIEFAERSTAAALNGRQNTELLRRLEGRTDVCLIPLYSKFPRPRMPEGGINRRWSRNAQYEQCREEGEVHLMQQLWDQFKAKEKKRWGDIWSRWSDEDWDPQLQRDCLLWEQHPRFRKTPHTDESAYRYEFDMVTYAVKIKVHNHSAKTDLEGLPADCTPTLLQTQTRNAWNAYIVPERRRQANHQQHSGWRKADVGEMSLAEFRECQNKDISIFYWDLAQKLIQDSEEASKVDVCWRRGHQCKAYMMGAECDCQTMIGTHKLHDYSGSGYQAQW